MHPQSRPQARPAERGSAPRHTGYDEDDDEEDDDDDDADGGFADGEGDPCPNCGRVYRYLHLLCHGRPVAMFLGILPFLQRILSQYNHVHVTACCLQDW
jgi:hypothetical protein